MLLKSGDIVAGNDAEYKELWDWFTGKDRSSIYGLVYDAFVGEVSGDTKKNIEEWSNTTWSGIQERIREARERAAPYRPREARAEAEAAEAPAPAERGEAPPERRERGRERRPAQIRRRPPERRERPQRPPQQRPYPLSKEEILKDLRKEINKGALDLKRAWGAGYRAGQKDQADTYLGIMAERDVFFLAYQIELLYRDTVDAYAKGLMNAKDSDVQKKLAGGLKDLSNGISNPIEHYKTIGKEIRKTIGLEIGGEEKNKDSNQK